jgi:hypothetical protein
MAKAVRWAMLPGNHEIFKTYSPMVRFLSPWHCKCIIHLATCFFGDLDGNQVLEFYWTDAIDAMTRAGAKLRCSIGPSECGRDRPGFGWQAVSQKLPAIQYYRVLTIINLKLQCFIMFYNVL